jgi:small neutral amino acid transporter SnatA (MarC family)
VSFGLLLLAFVAAVNPCRTSLALPRSPAVLALGSLVALAAGAALAAAGSVLLEALDVSPESFGLAAGLVLVLEGMRALVLPRPADEPELPGLGAALVPVAFPLLLQPGVVVLALAAGADDVAGRATGALAAALFLVTLAGARPIGARGEALFAAGGRVLGALEIAAGAALAVEAIRDV